MYIVLEGDISVRAIDISEERAIQALAHRVIGKERPGVKDANVHVAVLADVRPVRIGALREHLNAPGGEGCACRDRLANGALGVFALGLLGYPRRGAPAREGRLPFAIRLRSAAQQDICVKDSHEASNIGQAAV